MTVHRINPPELAPPYGFSHAVVAEGRFVFLAGQTGQDAEGRIVDGGVVPQFEQALANLLTALGAAGGSPPDLVAMTVYVVDVDAYQRSARDIGAVWRRLIGRDYPAMAAVGVSRLWDSAALVEVQATAVVAPVDRTDR